MATFLWSQVESPSRWTLPPLLACLDRTKVPGTIYIYMILLTIYMILIWWYIYHHINIICHHHHHHLSLLVWTEPKCWAESENPSANIQAKIPSTLSSMVPLIMIMMSFRCSLSDTPVFLPVKSPTVPFRLVVFELAQDIQVVEMLTITRLLWVEVSC